jgi:hypothetical protein
MRSVIWIRIGIVMAMILPLALICGFGTRASADSAPEGEKTFEKKALDADPELRKELSESDVYIKLKAELPKFELDGKTYYIAEGDLWLDDDQLLFHADKVKTQIALYKKLKKGSAAPQSGPPPGHIIAMTDSQGRFLGWKPGSTITYVLNKASLGNQYQQVKEALAQAVQNWKQTEANIFFKHLEDKDGLPRNQLIDATGAPIGFTFLVELSNQLPPGMVAMAFFPSEPKSKRRVLLGSGYTNFSNKPGVLTHELGHVLGFRHEHIRSGAPAECPRVNDALGTSTPLSEYDPSSVMHYSCGGVQATLTISPLDREGVRACYGTVVTASGAGGFSAPSPPTIPGKSQSDLTP